MGSPWGDTRAFLEAIDPQGFLEAAVLLKRTGAQLASWTRTPVAQEVVSVMAATMLGSVETIVGALGGPNPTSVLVLTPKRRMLAHSVDAQAILFLVAPLSVREKELRAEADRIIGQIVRTRGAPPNGSSARAIPPKPREPWLARN